MAIELMEGGELFERIVKKTFYNEMDARGLVRILLDALAYFHHRGIVHRDLKPENAAQVAVPDFGAADLPSLHPASRVHRTMTWVVSFSILSAFRRDSTTLRRRPHRRGSRVAARNDFDIKLADFAPQAKKVEGKSLDTQCGTPGYVAPEILKGKKYGTAVDMWSCGAIVYILLGGYPPFHDDNHAILYRKIKAADYAFDPQYWDQVSDDAKDLIKKMLVVDPDKRSLAASLGAFTPSTRLVSRNDGSGWSLVRC